MRHLAQRAGHTQGVSQAAFVVARVDPQREGEVLDHCTGWMVLPTFNDLETQCRECVAERQGDLFVARALVFVTMTLSVVRSMEAVCRFNQERFPDAA